MTKFLTSNGAIYRLARTIVQLVLAFCITNCAQLVGHFNLSADMQTLAVGFITAVLSPIMAKLKAIDEETVDEE